MFAKLLRSKITLTRLPSYSFCTSQTPQPPPPSGIKLSIPTKQSLPQGKTYLILPLRSFIFQSKPCSIKINRVFYQLLQKHDVKETVVFPLKDTALDTFFEITSYNDLKTKLNLTETKEKKDLMNNSNRGSAHTLMLHTSHEAGIPYINSINDIYPIGTLCDIMLEEYREYEKTIYVVSLHPKNKVIVNLEQNNEMQQFYLNGVSHYESFTSDVLEPVPTEMPHLKALYEVAQEPIKDYFQFQSSIYYDDNYLENKLMSKGSVFLNQMCCYICNTAYYLSSDQKFLLYREKTMKKKVELLFQYYKGYVDLFAKIWNTIYDEKDMGSKKSIKEALEFLQSNMQGIMKIKIQADPEIEMLKKEIAMGKAQGVLPEHILEVLEADLRDIEDSGSSTAMNNETKTKKHRIKTILSYPFGKFHSDNYNIEETKKILDEDHYGMKKVKERIVEFLAVGSLKGSVKSKVILLYGPPGVGKTSIVKSIARCMGRPFHRISLGGETDPSTLRGHKRTYIGAYPGKIFQSIKRSKVQNPIILLDEIDKMQRRYSGGSIENVLMNILDPAQNHKFKDDFIDLELDISNVLFVCTANKLSIIQPLLDRMEIIKVDGYSSLEKKEIFHRYLLPKGIEENGLQDHPITLTEEALDFMINGYNREPGVRSLEQAVNKLCQKIAYKIVSNSEYNPEISKELIVEHLGTPTFIDHRMYPTPPAGMMVGLAYSELGGGIMYIQAVKSNSDADHQQPSKQPQPKQKIGKLTITGNLKTVIKQSSEIAFSYANFILHKYFKNNYLDRTDIHLNFVGIATPKQGPSAGAAITSTLISLALNKPACKSIAMTGEINLSGYVTKIGGVKEKVLAAKREGIMDIILPMDNKNDFEKLDEEIKGGIQVTFAEHYFDVMKVLFEIDLRQEEKERSKVE